MANLESLVNEPAAADEQVVENEQGANPDHQLNPHMGHLDPDQKPDGNQDEDEQAAKDETDSDSPSDGEEKAEIKPDEDADRKLERKLGELAYENRQLKRRLEAKAEAAPREETPEPLKTLKDFGYDEQAFNGYLIDEGARRGAAQARRELASRDVETEAESTQREFQIREEAFEAENPGFKERLHAEDLMISPEMAQFITDPASEVGLHVGDYLARNKTEAAKIAGMTPTQQAREMTKLEARIGREVAKARAAKSEASKAPKPPANAIDGSDPGVKARDPSSPADADKMSDEEWLAAREKQLAKRRA